MFAVTVVLTLNSISMPARRAPSAAPSLLLWLPPCAWRVIASDARRQVSVCVYVVHDLLLLLLLPLLPILMLMKRAVRRP